MTSAFLYDPEHWRTRAQTMRVLADQVQDLAIRQIILRIAADFGRLAAEVEEQGRKRTT